MCDFLVSLGDKYNGKCLLELIKVPYGKRSPDGKFYDFPWGSVAILYERLAEYRNIYEKKDAVFGWVGDLVMDLSEETIERVIKHIAEISDLQSTGPTSLEHDELFKNLNGAFAILFAYPEGISIITDPMNFTPVYTGMNSRKNITSLGTHPDLTACTSSDSSQIDDVSLAEFLNLGHCSFPNTIYSNVKEINPGRLHIFRFDSGKVSYKEDIYWLPPREIRRNYNEDVLIKELRNAIAAAVRDRCTGKKTAVSLSGGQDSRLIMAAVPANVECIGLTFSEVPNRETRIASKVAKCYNRQWYLLTRDEEYLANSIPGIIRLMGCEFDWVDAHSVGFVDEISKYNISTILGGMQFDVYLKALFAFDIVRIQRLKGLLPYVYQKREYDFIDIINVFWKQNLNDSLRQRVIDRRKRYYEDNLDTNRGSTIESLILYPFSQDAIGACWAAERRILPVKLVAMDRRILDFAFKCPVELKLGKKIFVKAAMPIYGAGAQIACSDNGVRPGSGHLSRLVQRAVRKSQDRIIKILERMGKQPKIQHSWSDYQKYWEESTALKELISRYGANLDQFDGRIFKERGRDLLKRNDMNWRNGFRLLQLAVWIGLIENYSCTV